uniref:Uncharacterized protein n=1 Tax=Romanomermis culicivorax TaxID=13658 RepID=A0A915IEX0_ROMCU
MYTNKDNLRQRDCIARIDQCYSAQSCIYCMLQEPQKVLHSRTYCGSINGTEPQCDCGLRPTKFFSGCSRRKFRRRSIPAQIFRFNFSFRYDAADGSSQGGALFAQMHVIQKVGGAE